MKDIHKGDKGKMEQGRGERFALLDLWRSLAVCMMVVWHALYDLVDIGVLRYDFCATPGMEIARYFIVCSFLLLAGISSRLSRNNERRCCRLIACAAIISFATAIVGETVSFGILHLLSFCVLLYCFFGKQINRLPLWTIAPLLAAFVPLHRWVYGIRVEITWLWWLGFRTEEFFSADYYPVLPWSIFFIIGVILGGRVSAWRRERIRVTSALTWPGRHALMIYLLHQPILWGLARLYAKYFLA